MKNNKLQDYFPMIRTRQELLNEIHSKEHLEEIYKSWKQERQEEFLDFCTGAKGVKVLYDTFFKEIMNPETVPERLEKLLGLLLGKKIKLLKTLPVDSSRLGDETSLLTMDILVQLEDGTLCNIEIQKVGYLFPGQRCACYSADLLLRQYKAARSEKQENFRYGDMKDVYTIVLFEKSPRAFHAYKNLYKHSFEQKSDSDLKLDLLQKYIFVPLDIFKNIVHTNGIRNELEAWLLFLSTDDPETIIRLITEYPEFRPLYEHIYDMCDNIERVMGMFSKELQIMDRNTVLYMVDQMQETIDSQTEQLDSQKEQIDSQKEQIDSQKEQIDSQKEQIDSQKEQLAAQSRQIEILKRMVGEIN